MADKTKEQYYTRDAAIAAAALAQQPTIEGGGKI